MDAVDSTANRKVVIGVVSDTHGHLYPEVKEALQGVDHIIHAGDVGSPEVLDGLRAIAPVTAVRGNCDLDQWAQNLPVRTEVEVEEVRILVGHIAARLRDAEGSGKFSVIVTGHSHMAGIEQDRGVLHLNPGSAGPRRFERPRTIGLLVIKCSEAEEPGAQAGEGRSISAEIVAVTGD
ncbi:MAG: metallophosphoesterase family protein [Thermoleophilia bacterium]|nr:metallophosphoesterase family protein [Thermoleophilia bacterium]